MKGSKQVLAGAQVHTGLAANGSVQLSLHGGGNLHDIDASHIKRSQQTSHITHHAAAERYDHGISICTQSSQLLRQLLNRSQPLMTFAIAHLYQSRFETGGRKRLHQLLAPLPANRRHRHNEEMQTIPNNFTQVLSHPLQQAIFNDGVVRASAELRWSLGSWSLIIT